MANAITCWNTKNTVTVFSHWKWWWRLIFCTLILFWIKSNCVKHIFSPGKLKQKLIQILIQSMSCFAFLCHLNDINCFLPFVKKAEMFWVYLFENLKCHVLIFPYHFVCCMYFCWTGDYNQTIYVSLDHPIGFFS